MRVRGNSNVTSSTHPLEILRKVLDVECIPTSKAFFVCGPNDGFSQRPVELIKLNAGRGIERVALGEPVRHAQYPGPEFTSTQHMLVLEGLPGEDDGAWIRSMYVDMQTEPLPIQWAPLDGDEWYSPW